MYLRAYDPDDETVRLAVGAWNLTWLSSVLLGPIEEDGRRQVTIETHGDFERSAPAGLKKWLADGPFEPIAKV